MKSFPGVFTPGNEEPVPTWRYSPLRDIPPEYFQPSRWDRLGTLPLALALLIHCRSAFSGGFHRSSAATHIVAAAHPDLIGWRKWHPGVTANPLDSSRHTGSHGSTWPRGSSSPEPADGTWTLAGEDSDVHDTPRRSRE